MPFRRTVMLHAAVAVAVFAAFYAVSLHSYPLFHALIEFASIAVAYGIFMMAWPVRRFSENDYLLFLGFAYLAVGTLDLLHTLSYKGMGLFPVHEANVATQLWIAARATESVALVIAPQFVKRKLPVRWTAAAFAAATGVFLVLVFGFGAFPDCYVEGEGLTPFKRVSEYVIALLVAAAAWRLWQQRESLERRLFQLVFGSLILTILAELAFTAYVSVYGPANQVGHFLKLASFYLIYRGVIENGLMNPYDVLFRELKASEQKLRRQNGELAREVAKRERRAAELRQLTDDLQETKRHVQEELARVRSDKASLVQRMATKTLAGADQAQTHARLVRTVNDLRAENEILRDQLAGYLRMFEQARGDIDDMLAADSDEA